MTRTRLRLSFLAVLAAVALVDAMPSTGAAHATSGSRHRAAAERVAAMVGDQRIIELAGRHRLDVVDVMWEDTGRYYGSAVGPNISDVTIEVEVKDRLGRQRYLMPVVRYPNFSDVTGDVDIDELFLRVGNHREGGALETITLRTLLSDPGRYMSRPTDGAIVGGTLLARRDDKVLVSAQSAFLPIPTAGAATFYPVIFNYQSSARSPAVLTILVTRQGTSMTIVDNARDTVGGDSWGQRLYLNAGGKRAPLSAERLADVQASGVTQNGEAAASLGEDANVLMLIQVPLKVKRRSRAMDLEMATPSAMGGGAGVGSGMADRRSRGRSDLDAAVLGHGPTEGPFSELAGLTIERDPRFPVRATVQFYQATSTGAVSRGDVKAIAAQIRKVYKKADYVGSLVLDADTPRPTRWDGATFQPPGLTWAHFPGLVERSIRFGGRGFGFPAGLVTRR
jgi:hypothetical protein